MAVLAVVGLLAYGLLKKSTSSLALGDPVPNATTSLPRLSGGGTGSVADYRGEWALVNGWASWCVRCSTESPALERFYRAHHGHDFTVVGIDQNDLTGDALGFVHRYGITYPQLRDPDGNFSKDELGTTGVPESFLLDQQGRLVLHSLGPVSEGYLRTNVTP